MTQSAAVIARTIATPVPIHLSVAPTGLVAGPRRVLDARRGILSAERFAVRTPLGQADLFGKRGVY